MDSTERIVAATQLSSKPSWQWKDYSHITCKLMMSPLATLWIASPIERQFQCCFRMVRNESGKGSSLVALPVWCIISCKRNFSYNRLLFFSKERLVLWHHSLIENMNEWLCDLGDLESEVHFTKYGENMLI